MMKINFAQFSKACDVVEGITMFGPEKSADLVSAIMCALGIKPVVDDTLPIPKEFVEELLREIEEEMPRPQVSAPMSSSEVFADEIIPILTELFGK